MLLINIWYSYLDHTRNLVHAWVKLIIITRFCTMPNADIPEQARNQAKSRLKRLGITAKDFPKANKLSPSTVYAVLNGQKKCVRGESHRAAVLLGLKNGVVLS